MAGYILKTAAAGSVLLLAGFGLLAGCSREAGEAPAASEASATMPGRQIAETLCAGCHAIGIEGQSPHADAPPFRTLSEKYPVRLLEEALAEGIAVGHEDMPEFQLEADQVEQLIVYLESIQAK
ncbi:cytochrome c family protein [Hyphomonas polymorpha PS728]|uniref:Cytochrome c family protein n=1 Tax=Hyphomonas polymorpha PS728 TaxID=1280954 RepID=A0A062VC95_9PROT|nr:MULTISPECIES: cytochrome c [Hyphomonas]KCZ96995.1 cytochrome c family protein [Hyphomonas polymorpha PS728]